MTRDFCIRCLKAALTCYCDQLAAISPNTRFVILQHPHERKKAIGTGRMAHLSLQGSRLIRGESFDDDPGVQELLTDPSLHCVILYPGPRSVNLSLQPERILPELAPAGKRLALFLIDGTWPEAKKMLRRSPRIASLPQVCFTPERPSEYRIRRQPAEQCLSTIEAAHRILAILEPEVDASNLLRLFRGMVDQQIRIQKERSDSYRT